MVAETQEALDMSVDGCEHNEYPTRESIGQLKVSGYTPVPDEIVKLYGFVTATVWGRVWRHCQGPDGVCRAKLATIGRGIGMCERTIIRHMEILVEDKYFEDLTPDWKNRPHRYRDTGKLRLSFSTEVIQAVPAMTQSQSAMTQSQRQGDSESVEESIKNRANNNSKKKSSSKAELTPEIKAIIESANREVDFMLKQAGLSAGRSWTLLPENYHPYGKAFCGATGITYTKSDLYKWMPAFETWQAKGHTPQMVIDAIQALKDDNKSGMISGPSSITWKMDAMVTERTAKQQKQAQQQEQAPMQIPEGWLKYYDNVPTA